MLWSREAAMRSAKTVHSHLSAASAFKAVRRLLLILPLLALASVCHPAKAGEALVLSTGMAEPWTTDEQNGFTDLLIPALFKRAGVEAKLIVNKASARAIKLADDGIDDGIAARVAGLEARFPNLVPVSEPIFINDFVAAGLGKKPARVDWTGIADYRLSYILGWQIFDSNVEARRELLLAKDSEQLFSLLKSRKIDILLHERWQALWQAKRDGVKLTVFEPPLARVKMYIYLNRRHADLAPKLSQELVAMKADGSYQAIARKAFQGLGPSPRLER